MLAFGVREANDEDVENATTEHIESDLNLVGITAVEDLLQDDVA